MFVLPDLPYDYEALAPTVSAETLHFHHDKHHKAYIDKTNTFAKEAGLEGKSMEDVIREAKKTSDTKLFNNAAQAWNHAFFWLSMTPEKTAGGHHLKEALKKIGGLDQLREAFMKEGESHFGSGWVWIVAASEGLKVISTHDADNPLVKEGAFPLLVCDLWEHAYYLDYQNDRKGFLGAWFDHVANWDLAENQLAAAEGGAKGFHYPASEAGLSSLNGDGRGTSPSAVGT